MPDQLAVLVLMRDRPDALLRLVSVCHRRGWTPTALSWSTDGEGLAEAAVRLTAPPGRCGAGHVGAQLRRLVDVLDVVCDTEPRLPDEVALGALRGRAPWRMTKRPVRVRTERFVNVDRPARASISAR
jgi:acetolactate synthase regulatory subunit